MNHGRPINRKRIIGFIVAGAALALIGGSVAFAADGGTPHTGTPPHAPSIALDAQGYQHVCVNQFPPYEVMRGNLSDTCFAGYLPSKLTTSKVAAGAGPQGPKGDTGATGPQGPAGPAGKDGVDAQALPYGVALVDISRGGKAATAWATLTTTIGSPAPMGDQASSTFRMTCSAAQAPCAISVQAYATVAGVKVYPRLDIQRQDDNGGPQVYCEYADGADNNGGSQAVGTTATDVPLGVGGSLDCGSAQTLPASGVVDDIEVPAGHYDISSTVYFKR